MDEFFLMSDSLRNSYSLGKIQKTRLGLGRCFVMNEVFCRFLELTIRRFEPQKQDLQIEWSQSFK